MKKMCSFWDNLEHTDTHILYNIERATFYGLKTSQELCVSRVMKNGRLTAYQKFEFSHWIRWVFSFQCDEYELDKSYSKH